MSPRLAPSSNAMRSVGLSPKSAAAVALPHRPPLFASPRGSPYPSPRGSSRSSAAYWLPFAPAWAPFIAPAATTALLTSLLLAFQWTMLHHVTTHAHAPSSTPIPATPDPFHFSNSDDSLSAFLSTLPSAPASLYSFLPASAPFTLYPGVHGNCGGPTTTSPAAPHAASGLVQSLVLPGSKTPSSLLPTASMLCSSNPNCTFFTLHLPSGFLALCSGRLGTESDGSIAGAEPRPGHVSPRRRARRKARRASASGATAPPPPAPLDPDWVSADRAGCEEFDLEVAAKNAQFKLLPECIDQEQLPQRKASHAPGLETSVGGVPLGSLVSFEKDAYLTLGRHSGMLCFDARGGLAIRKYGKSAAESDLQSPECKWRAVRLDLLAVDYQNVGTGQSLFGKHLSHNRQGWLEVEALCLCSNTQAGLVVGPWCPHEDCRWAPSPMPGCFFEDQANHFCIGGLFENPILFSAAEGSAPRTCLCVDQQQDALYVEKGVTGACPMDCVWRMATHDEAVTERGLAGSNATANKVMVHSASGQTFGAIMRRVQHGSNLRTARAKCLCYTPPADGGGGGDGSVAVTDCEGQGSEGCVWRVTLEEAVRQSLMTLPAPAADSNNGHDVNEQASLPTDLAQEFTVHRGRRIHCQTQLEGGLYLPNLVEAVTYCQAAGSAALCSALAYRQRDGMTLLCRGHHDTAGGGTAAYDVSSWVTVLRKVLPPADRDL